MLSGVRGSRSEWRPRRTGSPASVVVAAVVPAVVPAVVAAVIAAAAEAEQASMLLALPPVCVVLGWTYLVNDEKISAIGRYIRDHLAPRLAGLTGDDEPVFGWESAHRADPRRASRKYLQLATDLIAFCALPAAAIVIFWVAGPVTGAFGTVSVLELAALIVLGWQIVAYADLRGAG